MHLTPNGCVANRFKMLEYCRVCSAFDSVCACPWTLPAIFETALRYFKKGDTE